MSLVELRARVTVNVAEAALLLGTSRDKVRDFLDGVDVRRPLPAIRHGSRVLIPVTELVDWASSEAKGGS